MERKVRDSCRSCGTGEIPQALCAEEAQKPPMESESILKLKSTTLLFITKQQSFGKQP